MTKASDSERGAVVGAEQWMAEHHAGRGPEPVCPVPWRDLSAFQRTTLRGVISMGAKIVVFMPVEQQDAGKGMIVTRFDGMILGATVEESVRVTNAYTTTDGQPGADLPEYQAHLKMRALADLAVKVIEKVYE